MFADVTRLRYWKSERADITTCEDAEDNDLQQGLFCVADGAGTTLFSNIWAAILVEQFVRDPLMSSDPFEMEWWIRQAQKRYRQVAPQSDKLNWNARQKALDQGAYSTLATLRFTRSDAQSAAAEMLVVGDSCIIVGRYDKQQIEAFPLQHPQDFDRAPYCVPSLPKNLNRYVLYPKERTAILLPGDVIMLATDAVARWIISGGAGNENDQWNAFLAVAQQTERSWPGFIDTCRADQSIVDDDCTAIIIKLHEEGGEGLPLGVPGEPLQNILAERKTEFEQARAERNKELLAIAYGDGRALNKANISLTEAEKAHARDVSDALRAMMQAMRDAINTPGFAAKIEPTWWQHANLLMDEPCAENIRKNLSAQGVRLKPPTKPQQPAPPAPLTPTRPPAQLLPPSPSSGEQVSLVAIPDPPGGPVVLPADSGPAHKQERGTLQQFEGSEPEPALVLSRSILAPAKAQPSGEAPAQVVQSAQMQEALKQGTAYQKIDAYTSVTSVKGSVPLDPHEREQLSIASNLQDAMRSDNDEQIIRVYNALEFSNLRNYFVITEEEQQRIQRARQAQEKVNTLRMMLKSGAATPTLLAQIYERNNLSPSSLAPDEQYIIDVSRRLLLGSQPMQCYYALYYSSFKIAFTEDEARQARAANHAVFSPPLVMTINQTPITISQILAYFLMRRRYGRSQVADFIEKRAASRSEQERLSYEKRITLWDQEFRYGNWLHITLNALIDQRCIELQMDEEIKRGNDRRGDVNLEKDRKREPGELAKKLKIEKDYRKELEALAKELLVEEKDLQASLTHITQQNLSDALATIALKNLAQSYLETFPEQQSLDTWLAQQRQALTITYYQYPEQYKPTTQDQQKCWLFKWWVMGKQDYRSM